MGIFNDFCILYSGVKEEFSLAPGLRPNNKPMHTNPEGVTKHRRGCQPPGKGHMSVCFTQTGVATPGKGTDIHLPRPDLLLTARAYLTSKERVSRPS